MSNALVVECAGATQIVAVRIGLDGVSNKTVSVADGDGYDGGWW